MRIQGIDISVSRTRTVVIGSGCAGLNAADWLATLGETSVLLMTDGMNRGTSRNAGSDKQTYYKLSLAGDQPDSVLDMARDLAGEGVHGDIALAEAAGSVAAFLRLAQLGVPFPTNEYGEFVGYQTDHDNRRRATSAGPLTSKMMTECLERQVRAKNVSIMDTTTAFWLLVDNGRIAGVLAYDWSHGKLHLVLTAHVVLATGGPAEIYAASVFPESQQGMSGMAVAAGAKMENLHQWQYGLASVAFRWNVSGSYQQVLPRYVSVDPSGVEREFLREAFRDPMEAVSLCFLKGYQWPFDVRKAHASSVIDLLVHRENALGRRVYMDFRRNPSGLAEDFSNLDREAKSYLLQTGSTQSTPFLRLMHMNAPAAALYRDHGIDLERQMLEIQVCAQHHNGGVAVDSNWMSSIPGLYAAGEAAGTFGAYRPGGSALNATQVGSMRAARHIALDSTLEAPESAEPLRKQIETALLGLRFENAQAIGEKFRREMSLCGAHMRNPDALLALDERLNAALVAARGEMNGLPPDFDARIRLRDQLLATRATISAMLCAAKKFGSAGAGLILDDAGDEEISHLGVRVKSNIRQAENLVVCTSMTDGVFPSDTAPARPIPEAERCFETVWRTYRERAKGKRRDGT